MKRIIYCLIIIELAGACGKSKVLKNKTLDADFTITGAMYPDSTIQFKANEQPKTSYNWDFGDGTIADGYNPTHKFPFGSVFNVTLSVTNLDANTANSGESKMKTKKVVLQVANGFVGDYSVSKMIFQNSTWPHGYVTVSNDTIHISVTDEQSLMIMGTLYYGDKIESGGYKRFTSFLGNSVHFYNNDNAFELDIYPYTYLGSRL